MLTKERRQEFNTNLDAERPDKGCTKDDQARAHGVLAYLCVAHRYAHDLPTDP
jgi:hypothetical protein